MGSNCGAGYMLPTGEDGTPRHPGWLNELWTAPVDFSPDAWECFVRPPLPPPTPAAHIHVLCRVHAYTCIHAQAYAQIGVRRLVAGDRLVLLSPVCACVGINARAPQFTAQDMIGMSSMCFGQQAACKLIESAGCAPSFVSSRLVV
jgi:hypothetical protein